MTIPEKENEIPLSFSMALSGNNAAMSYFSTLTPAHRREVIAHAHAIRSKAEMERFVSELDKTKWI